MGKEGSIKELLKNSLGQILQADPLRAETEHLGYEKNSVEDNNSGNAGTAGLLKNSKPARVKSRLRYPETATVNLPAGKQVCPDLRWQKQTGPG